MKKFVSTVAAAAILMSTYGVAFAYDHHDSHSSVRQFAFTQSETTALSNTGENLQAGGGTQSMATGASGATARSLTLGNLNVSRNGATQYAYTGSSTGAESNTGYNTQATGTSELTLRSEDSHHHDDHNTTPSTQSMVTGTSSARAGSITVSNVNLSFH